MPERDIDVVRVRDIDTLKEHLLHGESTSSILCGPGEIRTAGRTALHADPAVPH
jgi:hypothetical protein